VVEANLDLAQADAFYGKLLGFTLSDRVDEGS
jgi:hypothetical protein